MDRICVAALQCCIQTDKQANKQQVEADVLAASKAGVQLIVLPELHMTPYFCQTHDQDYFNEAACIPGPYTRWLAQLAKQQAVVIVGSVFEKCMQGLYYNTAVVIDKDGELKGCYRKMHIPEDPGYHEKYYFTPGDGALRPITTSLGKLGVLVCWDQWFPEAARCMALAGADLLIYPTAIGWDLTEPAEHQRQLQAWMLVQRGHAVANHLPVITCNRIGLEPDLSGRTEGQHFWGNSFICDQQGQLLAQADEQYAQPLIAEINLKLTTQLRQQWPFFRDRRIDAYAALLKRDAQDY